MKVGVLGVVYPQVLNYLDDYFRSLTSQTYMKYDLILLNDGVQSPILEKVLKRYPSLNFKVIVPPAPSTPATVREFGIQTMIDDRYDYLIFSDTDDFFDKRRIEKNIEILNDYDFCYNNIILVNENGKVFLNDSEYYYNKNNPLVMEKYFDLFKKNCCGLSNTAINLKRVDLSFLKIPANLMAIDWWIFSSLLIQGYKGIYQPNICTYYRQYSNNLVGANRKLDSEKLFKGIQVIKTQYQALLNNYDFAEKGKVEKRLKNILYLNEELYDAEKLIDYLAYINKQNQNEFLWWENIKTFEELEGSE